jgi:hypothetical protein
MDFTRKDFLKGAVGLVAEVTLSPLARVASGVLAGGLATRSATATPIILVGADSTEEYLYGAGSPNIVVASLFTAVASGTATSLSIHINLETGDPIKLSIWTEDGLTKLGETAPFADAVGIQTANLLSGVAIVSGTSYLLAAMSSGPYIWVNNDGTGWHDFATDATYPSWPAAIPHYTNYGGGKVAIWAEAESSAATFDFYIGPSGNNSNVGSEASPWALSALWSKPDATLQNKTIGLLDGTYIVTGITHTGSNTGGKTLSAPGMTVKAVNARAAIITTNNGGNYPQATDPAFQLVGDAITIDGLRFAEFSFDPLRVAGDNVTIQNCDFFDVDLSRYSGYDPTDNVGFIMIAGNALPANLVIDNCRFDAAYNGAESENGNCIGPLYHAGPVTITRCSFYNANVAIGWKASNNGPLIVERCYFDATIEKLACYGGMSNDAVVPMDFTFRFNVVNRAGYALDVWNVNNPHTETHSNIQNNTFIIDSTADAFGIGAIAYGNDLSGPLLSGAELNQCILRNNIFHRISGSALILFFQSGRNTPIELFGTIDYNLYNVLDIYDGTTGGAHYTALGTWQTRLAAPGVTGREANSQVATPTFVNVNGNTPEDYALAGGSAGKNDGSDGTDVGAWGGGNTAVGATFA